MKSQNVALPRTFTPLSPFPSSFSGRPISYFQLIEACRVTNGALCCLSFILLGYGALDPHANMHVTDCRLIFVHSILITSGKTLIYKTARDRYFLPSASLRTRVILLPSLEIFYGSARNFDMYYCNLIKASNEELICVG